MRGTSIMPSVSTTCIGGVIRAAISSVNGCGLAANALV